MTAAKAAGSRAFVVWFSEAERWNPGSFTTAEWAWPAEVIRPLHEALVPISAPVRIAEFPEGHPPLVTIRFDGSMEKREGDPEEIKGRLFRARAGELVYSKIDVRNGAIGIVPAHLPVVAVTAEYPVHHVRGEVADVNYVRLLVRSTGFRRQILSRVSGASGRKRIMPAELLAMRAPFPAPEVQKAIVAHSERAEQALRAAEAEASLVRRKSEVAFLSGLGLVSPEERERPKVMVLKWSAVERWGVLSNQLAGAAQSVESGTYAVVPLAEILTQTQYGTSEKANTEGRGVAVVRICNVKDGTVSLEDVKYVELGEAAVNTLSLTRGDILIIRTSGSRDLVGTTAVVPETLGPAVFASYLIRLRIDTRAADPGFVSAFLNGIFGRAQVNMAARQIMQSNINSEEIRALRIPLPPLGVQCALVDALTRARVESDALVAAARARHASATAQVDAMIFGSVPSPSSGPAGAKSSSGVAVAERSDPRRRPGSQRPKPARSQS